MNKAASIILTAAAAFAVTGIAAQEADNTLRVDKQLIERSGDYLLVDLTLNLSDIHVSSNQSIIYTPLITRGDSARALPPLIVNGRTRHILYERTGRDAATDNEFALRRRNGTEQTFDYHARVPYAAWMGQSTMEMAIDDCGCGWQSAGVGRDELFPIALERPEPKPFLAYIAPKEEVKTRALSGSAFLDFPVNRVEVHPDYRGNAAELAKIRATIDQVRTDKYATITGISIKGYASPEGSYANNERLAKGRSEALLDYVRERYDLAGVETRVDYEPEDWEGLERRVEATDLADKADILAIIRADEPADWDAREARLKTLNGGESYRYLLKEIYPALRHSDYEVAYTIRPLSVAEAKELIYTDPRQLSLDEMFQVARTYEAGSPEFNEVFEIAVRMYPDDPVSNLNAANTALRRGNPAAARRYLAKAVDGPEKRLAEGVASWLEGDTDAAKSIFESLASDPAVGEQARENLKQLTIDN